MFADKIFNFSPLKTVSDILRQFDAMVTDLEQAATMHAEKSQQAAERAEQALKERAEHDGEIQRANAAIENIRKFAGISK